MYNGIRALCYLGKDKGSKKKIKSIETVLVLCLIAQVNYPFPIP